MKSNEFRIFISSTFRDLMPEREQLVKKVFPQIRALCRERGVEFTEIDLRWGITDEEARTGKTVRICLEEIDKCRPYFLGIIGSRYGWIPGTEFLGQDATLFHDYPWIEKLGKENKSITDIEFSHGAILPGNVHHAAIYEQVIERIPLDGEAIDDLRSRIISSGVPHHTFVSPQELGEKVLRDLTAILDRDWPAKKEMTPAERERSSHEAFAKNRTHSYIANPEYYKVFEAFVDSEIISHDSGTDFSPSERTKVRSTMTNDESRPLILWGKSGFGKSALMAHLTTEYLQHHPQAFIIRHFVGATASASSADDVIRHIMLEIKERYELTDELPQSDLQSELPVWLAKIKEGEKLILAIDAVNQLTGIGNEMHWLPEFIPANIRLIISTTPELPLEQLRKRNWQEMEILPLSSSQRLRISKEFLAHYHKSLSEDEFNVLADEPKLESPLFLRTVLEEMRIFGVHGAIDSHLATYISCDSEAELFQAVLARMERDHGAETVRNIMTALWASRFGLTETELMEITGISRLLLSEFLIALEFHLMKREGLFTFFHNYLREAVETRYIASLPQKKEIHHHLANYFSGLSASKRRSEEEPTQWIEAGEREKLLKMFADSKLFLFLGIPDRYYELLGYWTAANANDEMNRVYKEMYHHAKNDISPAEQANLFTVTGSFLTAASQLELAEEVLIEAVAISKNLYGDNQRETANALRELATVFLHRSKNSEAADAYKKAMTVFENMGDLKELSETQSNLAAAYYNFGNYEEAIKNQRASLKIATKVYGRVHPIISEHLNNLAVILSKQNLIRDARIAWDDAIKIGSKTRGTSHVQTVQHRMNLANVLIINKEYEEALSIYNDGLLILSHLLGSRHQLIGFVYRQRSEIHMFLSKFNEARDDCKKAILIFTKLYGDHHIRVVNSYLRLARIEKEAGNYYVAEIYYQKYFPLLIQKIDTIHPEAKIVAQYYLDVLTKLYRREEIEKLLLQFPSLRTEH